MGHPPVSQEVVRLQQGMLRRAQLNEKGIKPEGHKAGGQSKGVNTLQFKIKDQDYFLAFVEQEKRWYVFAPTSEGVNRIPVYVDAEKYERPGILETETHLSF
jgi:hypothetical protein